MDDYQPRDPDRRQTWSRLSPAMRLSRLDGARRRLEAIGKVRARGEGETERAAIARVVTWAHRSSYRRWRVAFDAEGFDGLIDWRIAPKCPMPTAVREAICALRRADPNYPGRRDRGARGETPRLRDKRYEGQTGAEVRGSSPSAGAAVRHCGRGRRGAAGARWHEAGRSRRCGDPSGQQLGGLVTDVRPKR